MYTQLALIVCDRQVMHKRKRSSHMNVGGGGAPTQPPSPLPSQQSIHDFHKFGVHPNSVSPGFHFHLAATINPDTGQESSSTTSASDTDTGLHK